MSSEEFTSKITKIASKLKGAKARSFVKGATSEVFVPTPKEAKEMAGKASFKNVLGGVIDEVNTKQHEADAQVQRLVAGETEDLHEVMLAMDEAETSFQMMMEIRNKLVDAYKELSRSTG